MRDTTLNQINKSVKRSALLPAWILLLLIPLVASCTPSTPTQAVTILYITPVKTATPLLGDPGGELYAYAPPACTEIGQTWASPLDGMTLVCVPAGEFLMGAPAEDELAGADERPRHTVFLDAYWVDQTEVTNAMYALCVAAGDCPPPAADSSATRADYYTNPAYANYPVLMVSWFQANAYCQWAGRRLLTEAEWEKAAHGEESRLYPWGDQPADCTLANIQGCVGDTQAVGLLPQGASPYGALDMAGNVWEWVADYYGEDYYGASPADNPTGPEKGSARALRGGSWDLEARHARADQRLFFNPAMTGIVFGFRCGY